jgi:phosphoenolpyruvate synthase/pyruvate phosphate dikinase
VLDPFHHRSALGVHRETANIGEARPGGAHRHAAIIAHELGIPWVVNTGEVREAP